MSILVRTFILVGMIGNISFCQILLLRGVDSTLQQVYVENCSVISLTKQDILICGPCEVGIDESIKMTKFLEQKVHSKFYYFVLFPMKEYQLTEIKRFGSVLYETQEYVIFKSQLDALSAYSAFEVFRIKSIVLYTSTNREKVALDSDKVTRRESLSLDTIQNQITDIQNKIHLDSRNCSAGVQSESINHLSYTEDTLRKDGIDSQNINSSAFKKNSELQRKQIDSFAGFSLDSTKFDSLEPVEQSRVKNP